MKINIKPKTLGVWLAIKMLEHELNEDELAKEIGVTPASVVSWKNDRHPPKLVPILRIIECFSKRSDDSPAEIMDELLDSIPNYRRINTEYRARQNAKQIKKNQSENN